jgi:hypothetical protein
VTANYGKVSLATWVRQSAAASINVGIFNLDLNQIGGLGGVQMFVTQLVPAPELGSAVLLGAAALVIRGHCRLSGRQRRHG